MSNADDLTRSGRCLCGAVRFSATLASNHFGACHCDTCRRWVGGPFLAAGCRSVAFEDDSHVGRYPSSTWAERGFCTTCGTTLFYHLVGNDHYIVAVGSLDDQSGLEMSSQVFIDAKPEHYAFANDTENLTGEQVFARVAGNK